MNFASLFARKSKIRRPRSWTSGVSSFTESELKLIGQLRYAEVLVDHSAIEIKQRMWPRFASRWDVFWDERFARGGVNTCRVYIVFPRSAPGYMTVSYFLAGPRTEYPTILKAVNVVEQMARARECQAIVCHVISKRISERVMGRWGYFPHAKSLGAGHFIRRLKS